MRAVLDPGVLVSAVITPAGTCGQVVALIEEGTFQLVASPKITAELQGALQRERFRRWASLERVDEFVAAILIEAERSSTIRPTSLLSPVTRRTTI